MRRIMGAIIAILTMTGAASAAADGSEFWTELFWQILEFIANAGGMWQL